MKYGSTLRHNLVDTFLETENRLGTEWECRKQWVDNLYKVTVQPGNLIMPS